MYDGGATKVCFLDHFGKETKFPKDPRGNLEWRRGMLLRAKRDLEFQEKTKELFFRDVLFAFNAFFFTLDVRKRPAHNQPFCTYPYQDEAILALVDSIENGRDCLLEKSRDMGVSWITICVFAWFWLNPKGGTDFLLGSRIEDYVDKRGDMRTLFEKLRYLIYKLPQWLRPKGFSPRKHDNYMRLWNPETGSSITGESNNANFSTGGRYAAILLDEFAKWEGTDESAWTASGDATPCRIPVSTPFGASGQYYKLVTNGKTRRITLHWSLHPEKAIGLSCQWPPPNEDEKEALGENWEPEVVLHSPWYDSQCLRRDKKEIAQELDIDYLGSGSPVFEGRAWKRILFLHKLNLQPEAYYRIDLEDMTVKPPSSGFVDDEGLLRVYFHYDPKRTYTMGVDVVEGVDGGDYAIITVLCRETKDVAASYYSRIDENFLARAIKAVSDFYSPEPDSYWAPWVGIETPGPGFATFDRCDALGINNLFLSPIYDSVKQTVSYKKGWRNLTASRATLIASVKHWLSSAVGVAHSRLIGELMTFVRNKQGKAIAKEGCHDDEIFGFGIALEVDQVVPYESREKAEAIEITDENVTNLSNATSVKAPTIQELCLQTALARRADAAALDDMM